MSNRYEAAVRVAAAPAIAAVYLELRNPAGRRIQIEEIGIFLNAATATGVGLIRATVQGTGGTATLGQAEDPSQSAAGASLVGSAYTAAPTIGTTYLRRAMLPAAIGAGIIWTWPSSDRLILAASTSMCVANISAAAGAATIDAYAVWIE